MHSLGPVVVDAVSAGRPVLPCGCSSFQVSQDLELLKQGHKACSSGAFLRTLVLDDCGQGISEYAVVMSMVLLLALVGVSMISTEALDTLRKVVAALH